MSSRKYEFCKHEFNEIRGIHWFLYKNDLGGSIILSFDGEGEPNWANLPENFPIEEAKQRAIDVAKG